MAVITTRRACLTGAVLALLGACAPEPWNATPVTPMPHVSLETPPEAFVAGEEVVIVLRVIDRRTNRPLTGIVATHDRLLHTFIVGADRRFFRHVHHEDFAPLSDEDVEAATFRFPVTFPMAGTYRLYVSGSYACVYPIEGFLEVTVVGTPEMEAPGWDAADVKDVADVRVSMRPSARPLLAGLPAVLEHEITTSAGDAVEDLEMFLGEEMHTAAFARDSWAWVHAHPLPPGASAAVHQHGPGGCPLAHEQNFRGPTVPVNIVFPTAGRYDLFSSFRRGGEVLDVAFSLKVEP